MQKLLIGVLSVATVSLAILCATQARRLRALQTETQATATEQSAVASSQQAQQERIEELQRANEQLERQVQKFATVTTQLRTNEARQSASLATLNERVRSMQKPSSTGSTDGAGEFGKGVGEMLGTMMKDPAMREMMREQQKAAVNMMYSGLFKDLQLSTDEQNKLKEILTDAQLKTIEQAPAMMANKDASPEATRKAFEESKKETDAQLKALLGDERFAYYQDYQKTMGERMQIDQLKTQLAGQNLALQDQQSGQLLQIMQEEKANIPPVIPTDNNQFPDKNHFTAENLEKQIKWMEDYNRRVLGRAGQVLTPEQLAQYSSFQSQQLSMQKLGLKMASQMFGGGNAAPTPPNP